eukprot:gene10878-10682_t
MVAVIITNTSNIVDDAGLGLFGAAGVTTAVVAGTTYVFAGSSAAEGITVLSLSAAGVLTPVFTLADTAGMALGGALNMTVSVVDGTPFLFVAGANDSGVSVFSVAANGALTHVQTVFTDAILELSGATGVATAVVGGVTYLTVSSQADDGVAVFAVASDGTLTNTFNVTDDAILELDRPLRSTVVELGGESFLIAPANVDDGLTVFRVEAGGTLTAIQTISDAGAMELDNPDQAVSAVVGGVTYVFVTSPVDQGIAVFSMAVGGQLTNVFNLTDDATLLLNNPRGIATL